MHAKFFIQKIITQKLCGENLLVGKLEIHDPIFHLNKLKKKFCNEDFLKIKEIYFRNFPITEFLYFFLGTYKPLNKTHMQSFEKIYRPVFELF